VRWYVGGNMIDYLAGPIIFIFFGLIWLISRGRAMGFGDAKLGLSIGLLLGADNGFSAIALSFWIGAASVLLYMLVRKSSSLLRGGKKLTMKSEIPFAPFMILGAWLAAILEINLLNVTLF
jgi:leader peptidase (prepilin peptidase)/N-methyltransferase